LKASRIQTGKSAIITHFKHTKLSGNDHASQKSASDWTHVKIRCQWKQHQKMQEQ